MELKWLFKDVEARALLLDGANAVAPDAATATMVAEKAFMLTIEFMVWISTTEV